MPALDRMLPKSVERLPQHLHLRAPLPQLPRLLAHQRRTIGNRGLYRVKGGGYRV
jgi:mRNA-degrading endonuclease RelE of RelBE toxin-antitoxin system